jgi:hypothetical protein
VTIRALVRWSGALSLMFGLGIGLGVGIDSASAASVISGQYNYGPINGHLYSNFTAAQTVGNDISGHVTGYAYAFTTNNETVAAGWIGTRAVLYKGSAICDQGSWAYNPTSNSAMQSSVSKNCGGGVYHAGQAQTSGWTGAGYSVHPTFFTPNVNF